MTVQFHFCDNLGSSVHTNYIHKRSLVLFRPFLKIKVCYIHSFVHSGYSYSAAVLNQWVATPPGGVWRFAQGRGGGLEIYKQSCQRMNLYSNAVNIYFYLNVS